MVHVQVIFTIMIGLVTWPLFCLQLVNEIREEPSSSYIMQLFVNGISLTVASSHMPCEPQHTILTIQSVGPNPDFFLLPYVAKCKILRINLSDVSQNYTLNDIREHTQLAIYHYGYHYGQSIEFHLHSAHVVSKANCLLGLMLLLTLQLPCSQLIKYVT